MKILITNDDGIFHPGIMALYDAVKSIGEVTIIAPHKERSAVSHAISINNPIKLQKVEFSDQIGYSCTGTPVDCVKLGLHEIFNDKPDLILSGINKGSNTSQNILYSGTVSAAVEGMLSGIPSMAFSITSLTPNEYESATRITKFIVEKFISLKIEANSVINVNIPPIHFDEINGIKITRQGKSQFEDFYIKNDNIKNLYQLNGELKIVRDNDKNDDHCVQDGFVSITPLQFDLTDYKFFNFLKDIENQFN